MQRKFPKARLSGSGIKAKNAKVETEELERSFWKRSRGCMKQKKRKLYKSPCKNRRETTAYAIIQIKLSQK